MPADTDRTNVEQRIVEAAAVLPQHGVVQGWSALRWQGAAWFDGVEGGEARPVVLGGAKLRTQNGLAICEERLPMADRLVVDGLPVASAVHAAGFEARYAPSMWRAAEALSMAAYNDLVSIAEMTAHAVAVTNFTGVPQLRDALPLMEENAWSPLEVRTAIIWSVVAGLPKLLCNVPVFTKDGQLIGVPDLFDVAPGFNIQYDSGLHAEGTRRCKDRDRDAAFRSVGIETLSVFPGDTADPYALAQRMLEARRRCRFEAPSRRSWTLEPPAGWVDTRTVALRRALSTADRDSWLWWQRAA